MKIVLQSHMECADLRRICNAKVWQKELMLARIGRCPTLLIKGLHPYLYALSVNIGSQITISIHCGHSANVG